MRKIDYATKFKRDYRRVKANPHYRTLDALLAAILDRLVADESLPASNRDHALTGEWIAYRECHIRPDLLLIYRRIGGDVLQLARLGSHSDLFR